MTEQSFLGRGWGFPVEFDPLSKEVQMLAAEADIRNSLELLLSTATGQRIMQPDYGCNLADILFEPLNQNAVTLLKDKIIKAIYYHEPRVEPEEVAIVAEEAAGLITIYIEYTVRNTNTRHNIVYPFYINEATNLRT